MAKRKSTVKAKAARKTTAKKKKAKRKPPTKKCSCGEVVHSAKRTCPKCQKTFPKKEKAKAVGKKRIGSRSSLTDQLRSEATNLQKRLDAIGVLLGD